MPLKLNIVGRRKPGTTLAEHRHHIRQVHGELVLRFIEQAPDSAPRRYVQNTVFDGQYRAMPLAGDPFALNRDFVTQVWVDDFAMLQASRSHPFYTAHLKDDEANFVDLASVAFLPSQERVVVTGGSLPRDAVKVFTFAKRAADADPQRSAALWREAAHRAGSSVLRHVQNDVVAPSGVVPAADAIDEFWLPDEAAAQAFLAEWNAVLADVLVKAGTIAAGSIASVLAREDVVYPGTGT